MNHHSLYRVGDEETARVQSLTTEMVACVNQVQTLEHHVRTEDWNFRAWEEQAALQRRALLASHKEEIHEATTNAANNWRNEYLAECNAARSYNQLPPDGPLLEAKLSPVSELNTNNSKLTKIRCWISPRQIAQK